MQSTETKGLEEKLDDETSVSAGFPGIKKRGLLLLRDKTNLCFLIQSCLILRHLAPRSQGEIQLCGPSGFGALGNVPSPQMAACK
jgi:hypothetical protein